MSSGEWKLENDLCRCCHAEGSFKNLAEPFISLGQEEVYSDMLQDCLNIDLTPVPGQLCAVTYTICEVCISRLRDATNFKKQVLDCELRFKDMYAKSFIKSVDSKYETDIKVEITDEDFKEEYSQMDEDEDDDTFDAKFNEDDDSKTDTDEGSPKKKTKKLKLKPKPKSKTKKLEKPPKTVKSSKVKKEGGAVEKAVEGEKKGMERKTTKYASFFTLMKAEDGSRDYTCNTCASVYKSRTCFAQHYRCVHLKQRPKLRSCHLCEVRLPDHLRAAHRESAHGIPAPKCEACGKKFAFPFQVVHHQKVDHMLEKKHICSICNKKFARPYKLTLHMTVHSTERNHKCEYCEKTFKRRSHLKAHLKIHLDVRRHVCSVCNQAFVQRSSLTYHITKKHPDMV